MSGTETCHDSMNSSLNSFANTMLRFDPNEKEHEKFELKKFSDNMGCENDMQDEETKPVMASKKDNVKDKNFWMSSSFASDPKKDKFHHTKNLFVSHRVIQKR